MTWWLVTSGWWEMADEVLTRRIRIIGLDNAGT